LAALLAVHAPSPACQEMRFFTQRFHADLVLIKKAAAIRLRIEVNAKFRVCSGTAFGGTSDQRPRTSFMKPSTEELPRSARLSLQRPSTFSNQTSWEPFS